MTFAAIVGVKDEVELVHPSLAHLRAIGVDRIVVCDYGSTDGTLDVLADECRAGDVRLVHVDTDVVVDYDAASAHDIARARETGTDWVLFLDIDEFVVPAAGRLAACAGLETADVLSLDRFNVVVAGDELLMPRDLSPAAYHLLEVFTRRVPNFRAHMHEHPDASFVSIRPAPKPLARRAVAARVAPGGHDVHADGMPVRRAPAADVIVAHVPFSTFARFERKVVNIREEIVRHPKMFEGDFAWHWRRWAEMTADALRIEFARQVFAPEAIARGRDEGTIRSVAALFAERGAPIGGGAADLADGRATGAAVPLRSVELGPPVRRRTTG